MTTAGKTSEASHEFQFNGRLLLRMWAPTLAALAGLVLLLRLLAWLGWLPSAAPVESSDEVLMRRRFAMTRAPSRAEVLIIGDSSSAIDVEAPLLTRLLPGQPEVLNQGMFMGIGMDIYGEAAGEFIKHHPDQVQLVILLVTAQELQNANMSPYHQRLWHEQMAGHPRDTGTRALDHLLAIDVARDRIAGQLIPMTLYGNESLFYGFTFHLRRLLPAHAGTMAEYGSYNPVLLHGQQTYRVTDEVRQEAAQLRARVPENVKLAVGVTPLPDSDISEGFRPRRNDLLNELNQTLRADYVLTNLPVRFPNGYFSSQYHLNPNGAIHFTERLARELGALPLWSQRPANGAPGK